MADNTTIEWTDATWNPVTGCTKVSPGCDHCYAETFAERWRGTPGHHFEQGFDVTLRPERLDQPLRWRKPRRIFVNSMSDLFHDAISDEFIARIFAVMARTPQHTYQLLTKRHGRMRSLVRGHDGSGHRLIEAAQDEDTARALYDAGWPLPNVWLGVSVEDQKCADLRVPALIDTPAAVRWLSCEPMLGPVDLDRTDKDALVDGGIDWVVVGGESGPRARPMHPSWARALRDQCADHRVPYFFKQWGQWGLVPKTRPDGLYDMTDLGVTVANDGTVYQPGELSYPNGSRWGEALRAGHDRAALTAMYRVGKKEAGRELDGRTWDQYPFAADLAHQA